MKKVIVEIEDRNVTCDIPDEQYDKLKKQYPNNIIYENDNKTILHINMIEKAREGYITICNMSYPIRNKVNELKAMKEALELLNYDSFAEIDINAYDILGEPIIYSSTSFYRCVALNCRKDKVKDFDIDKYRNLKDTLVKVYKKRGDKDE